MRAHIIETTSEYADEYKISAVERIYQRRIVVYDKHGTKRRSVSSQEALEVFKWPLSCLENPWFLLYDPNPQCLHYDVLQPQSPLPQTKKINCNVK